MIDNELVASLTRISARLKSEGMEREAGWIARHIAEDIRAKRERPAARGVKVRLGANRRPAVIAVTRLREMLGERGGR